MATMLVLFGGAIVGGLLAPLTWLDVAIGLGIVFVLVGSTNGIVPSWEDAVEDARAQEVYGKGSVVGKLVSLEYERVDDRTRLVRIDDRLGL